MELLGKPRMRKRRRQTEGFLKGAGVHRRNSWVLEMGRGREKRREQEVSPAPGLGP